MNWLQKLFGWNRETPLWENSERDEKIPRDDRTLLALYGALRTISKTRLSQDICLRGSLPLFYWLPGLARIPGDLDFVLPSTWTGDAVKNVLDSAKRHTSREKLPIEMDWERMMNAPIWTYSDTPGVRFQLPYQLDRHSSSSLQLDFSFHDLNPTDTRDSEIVIAEWPNSFRLKIVRPEFALACKLAWLAHDKNWQTKDVYDVCIMVEYLRIDGRVLRSTLARHNDVPDAEAIKIDELIKLFQTGKAVPQGVTALTTRKGIRQVNLKELAIGIAPKLQALLVE